MRHKLCPTVYVQTLQFRADSKSPSEYCFFREVSQWSTLSINEARSFIPTGAPSIGFCPACFENSSSFDFKASLFAPFIVANAFYGFATTLPLRNRTIESAKSVNFEVYEPVLCPPLRNIKLGTARTPYLILIIWLTKSDLDTWLVRVKGHKTNYFNVLLSIVRVWLKISKAFSL